MQSITGKINGQPIELNALTENDIEKINSKLELIPLEKAPQTTDDLKPGVLYSFPAPEQEA